MPRAWDMNTLLDFYHLRPFIAWKGYGHESDISRWCDVVDWVGDWLLQNLATTQGSGCDEFVYRRKQKGGRCAA